MADIDIDPFGERESRTDEMGVKVFLLPQLEEDRLENQNVNRKDLSEGCQVQEQGLMLYL